jgi:hypothetical protein
MRSIINFWVMDGEPPQWAVNSVLIVSRKRDTDVRRRGRANIAVRVYGP